MKQITKLFPLVALALFAWACTVNVHDGDPVAVDGEEGRLVTLSLAIPGSPVSRGLDDPAENAVTTIDVLLFTADGNDRFRYRALATSITGASSQKEFTVKLPEETWNVVVLANARGALAASPEASLLVPSTLAPGSTVTRATILGGLVQQLTATGNKWTDESFPGIPMWGYRDNLAINASTLNPAASIDLTRAIARVDVSVKDDATLRDKFYLSSARLYNYNRAGSLSPAAYTGAGSNVGGYNGAQWNGSKAIAPNLPGLTPLKVENSPLVYDIPTGKKHEYKQEIYTFEAAAGTANTVTNTCLVLGGYYKADAGSAAVLTYYRVEFVNSSGQTDEYLPLLRNHNYSVTIQAVNGEGYPTPEGAYNNKPSCIVVNVVDWNDGGLNETDFTGQHYLSVDKSELVYYAGGGEKSLKALTDYPGGWTLDLNGLSWLTAVSPLPPVGLVGQQVTLTLAAAPLSGSPGREGYIYLVAGNLKKRITVRQLEEEELSLEVLPWELTFYKTPPVAKTVTLFPTPGIGDGQYTFGSPEAKGNIAWTGGGQSPVISGTTLTLKPGPNGGTSTLGSTVLVTLNAPDGRAVTQVVNVRQLGRDMDFTATPANPYAAAGVTNQTFPVTSEAPWKFTSAVPGLTLEDETGWHAATTTAYQYKFSLAANPLYATRDVTVNVTSSDEDFALRSFDIQQLAVAPYLDVTDPSNKTHDFGMTETAKEVKFTTNAKSKYTTGAGYADVISGQTVTAGAEMTATATPSGPVNGSVTFTPSTSNAGWGGSTKSTDVTFSTAVGVGGVNEDSETVTLSRTIPAVFTITEVVPSNGSEIEATATDVTVKTNTNLKWWIEQIGGGGKSSTAEPGTYTEGGTWTVTIPARSPSVPASWTDNATVTVNAGYDAQNGLAANTPTSYTYTQLPYTLEVSHTPTSPTNTVTITVTTNAASVPPIRLNVNNANGQEVVGATPMNNGTGHMFDLGTVVAERTIAIVNNVSGVMVASFKQLATTPNAMLSQYSSCPDGWKIGIPWNGAVCMWRATGQLCEAGLYPVYGDGVNGWLTINANSVVTNYAHADVGVIYTFCVRE
ncbi:MAG: hypothetical protein LBK12_08405 [Odoribacteraceae bacterium]|jgi:hypothetical protein|nr:hypothetical protein [Odoribacteraceae bacterium]